MATLPPMICPSCNSNTISVLTIWASGIVGSYQCPNCKTPSTAATTVVSLSVALLIILPFVLGMELRSWRVFVIGSVLSQITALVLFTRYGRLKASRRNWSRTHRSVHALFIALLLWLCFIFLSDETLDPGLKSFFVSRAAIEDSENAAVALSGINAPIGVDVLTFGRTQIDAQISKTVSETSADPPKVETLEFIGTNKELLCWILPPTKRPANTPCATKDRIEQLLHANATLLERYWWTTSLQHFQGWTANVLQLVIDLQRLIAADIELKLRAGEFEPAYHIWRMNCGFVFRMLREDTDFVEKAVFMVAESACLKSAELLIYSYPNIADIHGDDLGVILKPIGLARWNLPGALRTEYARYDNAILSKRHADWVHPNFIRNRFYRVSNDLLVTTALPPPKAEVVVKTINASYGSLWAWNRDYFFDPVNAAYSQLFFIGPVKGFELITTMHQHDGQFRALTLALDIKRQHIADSAISSYIRKAPPDLSDPFTSQPMDYNPQTKTITFHYSMGIEARDFEVRL